VAFEEGQNLAFTWRLRREYRINGKVEQPFKIEEEKPDNCVVNIKLSQTVKNVLYFGIIILLFFCLLVIWWKCKFQCFAHSDKFAKRKKIM